MVIIGVEVILYVHVLREKCWFDSNDATDYDPRIKKVRGYFFWKVFPAYSHQPSYPEDVIGTCSKLTEPDSSALL